MEVEGGEDNGTVRTLGLQFHFIPSEHLFIPPSCFLQVAPLHLQPLTLNCCRFFPPRAVFLLGPIPSHSCLWSAGLHQLLLQSRDAFFTLLS